jgi:hypothetical protein
MYIHKNIMEYSKENITTTNIEKDIEIKKEKEYIYSYEFVIIGAAGATLELVKREKKI